MKRLIYAITALIILTGNALSAVSLCKCFHDQTVYISSECCQPVVVDSCCESNDHETVVNEVCCDKIDLASDLNTPVISNDHLNKNFILVNEYCPISNILVSATLIYSLESRGPPGDPGTILHIKEPYYVLNCSFLC